MRLPLQPLKRGSRQRGVHHHQHAMLFRDWPAPPSLPSFAVLPAGSGLHSPSHGSQRENGCQAQILSFDRKHRSTARGMLLSRDLVARPECHCTSSRNNWTSSRTRPSKNIQQLTTDVSKKIPRANAVRCLGEKMESEGGLYSWRSGDHVLCPLERKEPPSSPARETVQRDEAEGEQGKERKLCLAVASRLLAPSPCQQKVS